MGNLGNLGELGEMGHDRKPHVQGGEAPDPSHCTVLQCVLKIPGVQFVLLLLLLYTLTLTFLYERQ